LYLLAPSIKKKKKKKMMTCVAHSTHGCALHAGCDGVRGGRIPEAGAGAAAVPGRPGQRTYASRLSQARLIAADG
jgi:hypothetical protein